MFIRVTRAIVITAWNHDASRVETSRTLRISASQCSSCEDGTTW
jgi:hypothetical protein